MMMSMACFAVEDTFIKLLSARLPATQILFSIGFGGALITLVLAIVLNVNLADKILLNKHVISRTIADLFGALSFTSAMVLIPMSLLASILQATPLFATLGAVIFSIGVAGIFLNRKNIIVILMSIELILLAVNIILVSFSIFLYDLTGQIFTLFILTVASAVAAIGLAIIVVYFRNSGTIRVQEIDKLKG